MRKRPEVSEVQVFNDFVAALTGIQNQLDHDYHHDRYLRDSCLTAIDIPSSQEPLRYLMPRDAQRVIQRTIRRLSDNRKTAGTLAAQVATTSPDPKDDTTDHQDTESNNSLGQRYRVEAKRPMKTYVPKPNSSYKAGRRINSAWLSRAKG